LLLLQALEDARVHAFGRGRVAHGGEDLVDCVVVAVLFGGHHFLLRVSVLQPFAEMRACAEEQRAHAGFTSFHHRGYFGGAEFFNRGEEQSLALLFWQALHCGEDLADAAGFGECLVGGQVARGELRGEDLIHLIGPDAAAAIKGKVPCDADKPWADFDDGAHFVPVLEDAEKDFLDDVLGLGLVAQDGECDAEEQAGVVANDRGEVGLSGDLLC
jgi:hypothetical protein